MARKDLLKGLMEAPAPLTDTAPPRYERGAIGAVSKSINDLRNRAIIDVPAELIDDAGLRDRLDEDPDGLSALIASIRALPPDGIDLMALYTGNLVDGVVHALGAEYRPLH